ncbi:hypothetical protein Dimus_028864 [Dionaea muscipula]
MPRVQLAHVPADDFDDFRFPSPFHEQHQWPHFVNRGIVSGHSIDLEPLHHKYLNDLLVGYGWGGLMDLPEVVYPNLVRMFYTNVELKGRGERTVLKFYLKGKCSKISEKIAPRERDRGNPRVVVPVAPTAPTDLAPAPVLVPPQFAQFQQSVTGRLQTLKRRYTELRTDSVRRTNHLARLEATQSSQANSIRDMEIEQIRLRNVIGQVRSNITHSEERIRTSIDDLTLIFRRRFPSPPADP